jgi:hypothetical protein
MPIGNRCHLHYLTDGIHSVANGGAVAKLSRQDQGAGLFAASFRYNNLGLEG